MKPYGSELRGSKPFQLVNEGFETLLTIEGREPLLLRRWRRQLHRAFRNPHLAVREFDTADESFHVRDSDRLPVGLGKLERNVLYQSRLLVRSESQVNRN